MINAFYGVAQYGKSSFGYTFVVSAEGTTIGLKTHPGGLISLKSTRPIYINLKTMDSRPIILYRSL